MSTSTALDQYRFQQLGRLRDVLELIGRIREISEPITSPEGLRQTIELLLRFADLLGVSADVTERLRQILADENVFQIVLAIVRFLYGVATMEAQDGRMVAFADDRSQLQIDVKDFMSWLRIVIEIINLLRLIRGGLPSIGI